MWKNASKEISWYFFYIWYFPQKETEHPSIQGACIKKDLADALLLQSYTFVSGLVEEGIKVQPLELASLIV